MTRMTGPDCAVMCNSINTHTHTDREDQCEWHRMARVAGPDCAVMCNLINTSTCGERLPQTCICECSCRVLASSTPCL